jgi:hypothetical protein
MNINTVCYVITFLAICYIVFLKLKCERGTKERKLHEDRKTKGEQAFKIAYETLKNCGEEIFFDKGYHNEPCVKTNKKVGQIWVTNRMPSVSIDINDMVVSLTWYGLDVYYVGYFLNGRKTMITCLESFRPEEIEKIVKDMVNLANEFAACLDQIKAIQGKSKAEIEAICSEAKRKEKEVIEQAKKDIQSLNAK